MLIYSVGCESHILCFCRNINTGSAVSCVSTLPIIPHFVFSVKGFSIHFVFFRFFAVLHKTHGGNCTFFPIGFASEFFVRSEPVCRAGYIVPQKRDSVKTKRTRFSKECKIRKKHKMSEQTARQTQDVVEEMKQERMMDKEEKINKLQKDIEPMQPIYSFYFFILYFRPDQMLSSRYRIRDFVSRLRCTAP